MSLEMDQLKAQVTATDGVIQSAIIAFQGVAGLVTDAAGDREASLALAADLNAQAAALAAAIPVTP
jgi:hypothetical protein